MEQTHTKKIFVVYLKFKFNWPFYIFICKSRNPMKARLLWQWWHRGGDVDGMGELTYPVKGLDGIPVEHHQCLLACVLSFSSHSIPSTFFPLWKLGSSLKNPRFFAIFTMEPAFSLWEKKETKKQTKKPPPPPATTTKTGFLQFFTVAFRSQIHCSDSPELKALLCDLCLSGYCLLPHWSFAYIQVTLDQFPDNCGV